LRTLAQLNTIAIKLQDTPLQLGAYNLKADYYYWNYEDNPMSLACYDNAIEIARNQVGGKAGCFGKVQLKIATMAHLGLCFAKPKAAVGI
jgi:hypothetical protein